MEKQFVLRGHKSSITALNILPDGRLISGSNKDLRVWNTNTGKCEVIFPIVHTEMIFKIEILDDYRIIIVVIKMEE